MESNSVFGRGRGYVSFTPIPTFGRGRSNLLFAPDSSTPAPGFERAEVCDATVTEFNQDDACTPKLVKDSVTEERLTGIASQIGLSIGESIASCIESRLGSGVGSSIMGPTVTDPSLLNVIVRSEVKEPVSFKGDGHDTHTVQEWEAVMVSYMKKKGIPLGEQAEEVMGKLVGRAREVVKVGIRSQPSLSLSEGPDPIFEILKQHFSDTVSSGMPLADFYATLPQSGERPFDYWLRLNRAMEVTEDCLRRQNKTFDNLARDLTAMFIRHCPDPELSLIFKCKPLQQWTVSDVHERLVAHSREHKHMSRLGATNAVIAQRQGVDSRACQGAGIAEPVVVSTVPVATEAAPVEKHGAPDRLDRLIAMLERVLEQQPQQMGSFHRSNVQARRDQAAGGRSLPCDICGEVGHTTRYHCRVNNLCFVCYAPGHSRGECPRAGAAKPGGAKPATRHEGN